MPAQLSQRHQIRLRDVSADSAMSQYNIKGHGKTAAINLTLTSGQ